MTQLRPLVVEVELDAAQHVASVPADPATWTAADFERAVRLRYAVVRTVRTLGATILDHTEQTRGG